MLDNAATPDSEITRYARALILALFDACLVGRPNSPPCPVNLLSYELLTTEWPVLCHLTREPQSQNPAASVEHGDKSPSAQLTTQQTCETSLQFFGIGGFRVRLAAEPHSLAICTARIFTQLNQGTLITRKQSSAWGSIAQWWTFDMRG